jgi:hypothetical protein
MFHFIRALAYTLLIRLGAHRLHVVAYWVLHIYGLKYKSPPRTMGTVAGNLVEYILLHS